MKNLGLEKMKTGENEDAEIKKFLPKLLTRLITEMEDVAKIGDITSLENSAKFHSVKDKIKAIIADSATEKIKEEILPLLETAQDKKTTIWREFLGLRREALAELEAEAVTLLVDKYKDAQALDKVKNAEKRSWQMATAVTDLETLLAIWEAEMAQSKKRNDLEEMARLEKLVKFAREKIYELIALETTDREAEMEAYEKENKAKVIPFRKKQ
jgi:phosphotransferase system IIB component